MFEMEGIHLARKLLDRGYSFRPLLLDVNGRHAIRDLRFGALSSEVTLELHHDIAEH